MFLSHATRVAVFALIAGPYASSQPNFTYVSVPGTNNIQTGLVSTFPTGIFTANNVLATPFSISTAAGKCGSSGSGPCNFYDGFGSSGSGKSITLAVSIASPTDVYTLMNAYSPTPGAQLATITFLSTEGASLTFPLIAGQDIRDYYVDGFANTLNNGVLGVQAVNAFTCTAPTTCIARSGAGDAGTYLIDEQHFSLGTTFAGHTLKQIVLTDTHDGSTPILLGVTVNGPGTPTVTGVVNAASLLSGPVSPGEIVTISGTNIGPGTPASLALDQNGNVATSIGDVQAFFNGIRAPLTYVSGLQINAVVPYGIIGLVNPSLQVNFAGQVSNAFSLQSAAAVPALFTLNASGTGPGAILNQDGTINSPTNPAPKGSYIVLYATGEGQTSPSGVTGKITTVAAVPPLTPQPLLPVAVTIGGQSAPVAFYGEAPGIVSGVMQINVQIPTTVPSGNLPVQLSVGGINSQSGVTVSML